MGNYERRPSTHKPIDSIVNKRFGLRIDRARCFVENEYGAVERKGAAETYQLLLSDR